MSKFKVGDVVVYSHNLYSSVRFEKGDTFKVTEVIGGCLSLESIESEHEPCGSYTADQFELVQPKPKFKVDDKIRCVDNSNYPNQLTVGKVYTVVAEHADQRYVRIVSDQQIGAGGYKVERFELVQEDAVLTPEEVFEHLRKGTKLEWRYKGNPKWQPCVNTGNVQVRCILDSERRIKPEPEVIELNGKKYREITD